MAVGMVVNLEGGILAANVTFHHQLIDPLVGLGSPGGFLGAAADAVLVEHADFEVAAALVLHTLAIVHFHTVNHQDTGHFREIGFTVGGVNGVV